ncbi:hypothetical protein FACS189473_0110 [Spirochaetia bacterium]|nr:hypothetical protein FACS189473_0110 [Spirochaetia bacterium]
MSGADDKTRIKSHVDYKHKGERKWEIRIVFRECAHTTTTLKIAATYQGSRNQAVS